MYINTKTELLKILKTSGTRALIVLNSNRQVEIKKSSLIVQLEYELRESPDDDAIRNGQGQIDPVYYFPESKEVKIFDI